MFVPLFASLYNGIGINSSLKIEKGIQVEKVVRFLPICSFMIRAGFIFIRCLVTTSVEQARWALILCIEIVKLSLSQKDYYVLLRLPFREYQCGFFQKIPHEILVFSSKIPMIQVIRPFLIYAVVIDLHFIIVQDHFLHE